MGVELEIPICVRRFAVDTKFGWAVRLSNDDGVKERNSAFFLFLMNELNAPRRIGLGQMSC